MVKPHAQRGITALVWTGGYDSTGTPRPIALGESSFVWTAVGWLSELCNAFAMLISKAQSQKLVLYTEILLKHVLSYKRKKLKVGIIHDDAAITL